MNLTAGITELRNRGFTDLTDARLTNFLNAGKNMFEDLYPWPWLETTATGTAPLTISDLKSVLMVSDTTNRGVLVGMDRQQILRLDPALVETTTAPTYWYLAGETSLRVWPASTVVNLSVLYIKFSPELTGSDTPLIPTRYHDLWIDFSAIEAYRDNDEYDTANGLYQSSAARAQALANIYMNRNWQHGTLSLPTFASEDS